MKLKEQIIIQKNIPFEERLNIFYKNVDPFTYKSSLSFTDIDRITELLLVLNLKKYVFGKIAKRLKGGFLIEFDNQEGFLPFSQYSKFNSLIPITDLNKLIGTYSEFEIIVVAVEPFVLILSRRSLQMNPEEEIFKKDILINEISNYILTNISDSNNSKRHAIEILQKADEIYYDSILEDISDDDIKELLKDDIEVSESDYKKIHYYEDGPYCEACMQSPCMCSDRERSSTVFDF